MNRIVVMYLDYAEDQTRRRRPLYMRDWREKLDAFLRFTEREVLDDPGRVSMEVAKTLAEDEYSKFEEKRWQLEAEEADEEFDRVVKSIESRSKGEKGDNNVQNKE